MTEQKGEKSPPHIEREIAGNKEEKAQRQRWADAEKSPQAHGYASGAEAKHAAQLHLAAPSEAEEGEYTAAFGLWLDHEDAEAALSHSESLKPLTVTEDLDKPSGVDKKRKELADIEAKLQDLNVAPLDGSAPVDSTVPAVDYSVLANKHQLIHAFGGATGMCEGWFKNLKDKPKLRSARKVEGQGGRGRRGGAEPLFCPYEVMTWLASEGRRVGVHRAGVGALWGMLEKHFQKAYEANQLGDPRAPT